MSTQLYHKRVWLPDSLATPDSRVVLSLGYTHHALEQARGDSFGDLTPFLPSYLFPERWNLVEVEAVGSLAVKCLYERPVENQPFKLALVCRLQDEPRQSWWVVTAWANHRLDQHDTLDKNKYEQPP